MSHEVNTILAAHPGNMQSSELSVVLLLQFLVSKCFLKFILVSRYIAIKQEDEEKSRLLIRAIYRLALAGIDINARDASGETALVKATETCDQSLMTHLLRLGTTTSNTLC